MKNYYRDKGLVISVLALVVITISLSVYIYFNRIFSFWIIAPFIVLSCGFAVGKLIQVTRRTFQYFARIDEKVELENRVSLYNFPISVVIVDQFKNIIWYNSLFASEFPEVAVYGNSIDVITSISISKLTEQQIEIAYNDKFFRVSANIPKDKEATEVYLVYFENISDFKKLTALYKASRPVVMIIVIDSYEELFGSNLESEKANITVQIDKLLEDFVKSTNGILKKNGRDKFWAVVEQQYIDKLISEKVRLLDKAREIQVTDRMNISLSIGIGCTGGNIAESETFAMQALDMSLGRGGDQAAIKTENGFEFYGGISKGIERQTRVKPRIIANSLIELVQTADNVYIMGHKFSDLDCIGAAVGLTYSIRNLGKTAYTVVDKHTSLGKQLISRYECIQHDATDNETSRHSIFMTPTEAKTLFTELSLLIVVDTHNPLILEDRELYGMAKKVVVIDHHRKMVNYIDNATIFHHEPYSSSASEMVTELLQYFGNAGKISAKQAEALLAGIMLDTKNFALRTGVRTFEAAAFLRKLGADTINVKALFGSSIEDYKQKAHIVSDAKIYQKCAIVATDCKNADIRIIAPQAADELLGISNVDASFVLFQTPTDEININARSLGAINVQIIMESLGGGGHQTMAGVQLKNVTLASATEMLKNSIDKYYGENE